MLLVVAAVGVGVLEAVVVFSSYCISIVAVGLGVGEAEMLGV